MTLAEQRGEVFRRLNESATAPVFWTVADVDEALNAGLMELSDASEWHEEYFEIDLLNNRPYYDMRTVIGPSFLALGRGWDEQTSRWLIPTSVPTLDAHDRRWERVTGEAQRIQVKGLWWLGLYPRIQSDVGLIKQYYTSLPKPMVEDTDEPGFPETYHDGCIWFALTELWAQDAETKRAMAAWKMYLDIEGGLVDWVNERAGGPARHGFGSAGNFPR